MTNTVLFGQISTFIHAIANEILTEGISVSTNLVDGIFKLSFQEDEEVPVYRYSLHLIDTLFRPRSKGVSDIVVYQGLSKPQSQTTTRKGL